MWFLMIAPQRKKEKERQRMLDKLEVDDHVVTVGGIHGYIEELGKETLLLEIADGVSIEVFRNAVALVKNEELEESEEAKELVEVDKKSGDDLGSKEKE
jgi:preprotein translocase subunit YajC